ncbi:MAG: GNAT family N-acetyltransferase [Phycisphaeraceae bacterium]|jgi:hypothetical protein|nr:GNAT family N-acetyltransferase [Phycisphaeraceae bacterium]
MSTHTKLQAAPPTAATPAKFTIEPVRDAEQLRQYIDQHWRTGHVLARDERMFDFQYRTKWVDKRLFPLGVSVLGAYEGSELVGFLGAIIAPYPRPQSYWLALWHVLPTLKGGGHGGKLLNEMQRLAVGTDGRGKGWIGTFGAGPEALPVYLKRGYACRAVRRWVYTNPIPDPTPPPQSLHAGEVRPPEEWLAYRYDAHPIFTYERRRAGIFRTEQNAWGIVTHVLRLDDQTPGGWRDDVNEVFLRDSARALAAGCNYLMDAWAIDPPGTGWTLAPDDLPSVFHPPTARGNLIYTVGRPFVCGDVQKGECDQDRPN